MVWELKGEVAVQQGFRLPRMTTAERTSYVPAATNKDGFEVYDTDKQCVYFYNGTDWVSLCRDWIKEECYLEPDNTTFTQNGALGGGRPALGVETQVVTASGEFQSFTLGVDTNSGANATYSWVVTTSGGGSSNTDEQTFGFPFGAPGSVTWTLDSPIQVTAGETITITPVAVAGSARRVLTGGVPIFGGTGNFTLFSDIPHTVRTYDDGSTYEVDTVGNAIAPITIDPSWVLTDCLSNEDEAKVAELANEAIESYTCELPCTSFDPSGFALQTVPLTPIDYQDGLVETRYLGYFDGGFATATGLAVPQANSFYSTHFNGTDWVIQTNNDPLNQIVFTPNTNTYLVARVELGASGASLESFPFECGDDVNGFQTIPQFGGLTISDNTFNGSGNAGELDVSGTWATDITSTVTICEGFNDLNSKLSNTLKTIAIDCYTIPSFVFQNPSTTEVGTTQGVDGISWDTVAVGQEFDRVTVLLRNTGAALTGVSYDIQDFDALITVATDPVDIPSGDSYVTFTFPTITVTAPIHANGELNLGSGGNVFPAQIVIPHTGNGSYSPFFNASNSESWIGSVSLSTDDTQVNVSTCSDGSQTAYDSNNAEVDITGGIPTSWEVCIEPESTVATATESFTSTNGVKVTVGGQYQLNTDGTTYAMPSVEEYNEFINNYGPQYIAISYEAAGGANVRINVNGVDATYTDLVNATDAGNGQLNLASGTNGVFNRTARVDAEVLKEVGDYVEIINPNVSPFSAMIIGVTQNTGDFAHNTSGIYNFRTTAGSNGSVEAYSFRDKTNTVIISGSETNATYRITRTLAGVSFSRNGEELYCTDVTEFTDYSLIDDQTANGSMTIGTELTQRGTGTVGTPVLFATAYDTAPILKVTPIGAPDRNVHPDQVTANGFDAISWNTGTNSASTGETFYWEATGLKT